MMKILVYVSPLKIFHNILTSYILIALSLHDSKNEGSIIGDDYINDEMKSLEKEQIELDEKALKLEKKLRSLFKTGNDKIKEDQYLREWFLLINKKNVLIHKQLELELM